VSGKFIIPMLMETRCSPLNLSHNRHLRIMDTGVDLKVFVLDLLSLFTALERVELAAGITVRELGLNYSSTSWTRLRFRTTLTFINIIETLDDVDSFWEFLSIHPAVEKVFVGEATSSLKSSNSYRLLRKIIPEAPRVLEGLSCFFLHIRIKKEKGTWWLKNVVMSIECGEGLVEGFCSKVQQLGHEFNGLEVLFLTTTKWDRNRRPEDPSIEVSSVASCIFGVYIVICYSLQDAFARALSTYNQLKHFSIWVPEDLKSYIEDNKQLLGLDPKYWGSAEHVYRRAAFRIAHRIAVAVPSIEQVDFLDILHNQNSVVFGENCYVIIQRDDADVKVVEGAIRFEYRSDRPYGTGSVVPVGDAWSPSML